MEKKNSGARQSQSRAKKNPPKKAIEVGQLYRVRASGAKFRDRVLRRDHKAPPKKLRKIVPVPSSRVLIKQSSKFMWANRKTLFQVLCVYGLLYALLVSGFGTSTNVGELRKGLTNAFGASHEITNNLLSTGLVIFGSGSGSSPTQQLYRSILVIVGTLAFVWTIRKLYAKEPFRIRDAYYRSMQPLFTVIIVELSILIKFVPFLISTYIYVTVKSNQLNVSTPETVFFVCIWLSGLVLSTFLVVPNILAIYAVTLPDVDPRQAILASKHMVRGQRLKVLGRLIAGVLVGFVAIAVIVLACIAWLNFLVGPLTLLLTFIGFMALHVYWYHVYRSML